MLISLLVACPPPVLPDTGLIPIDTSIANDSGADSATDSGDDSGDDTAPDTGDSGTQIDDNDGDGFSPRDADEAKRDCDDDDPSVYPGAPELLSYKDEDCDGELIESIDAFSGATKVEPVGLVWALEGLQSRTGEAKLAGGMVDNNLVMVVPASDLGDGSLGNSGGGAAVSHAGGANFGFSLVQADYDGDGEADLFIGEPGEAAGDATAYYLLPSDKFDDGAVSATSLWTVGDASLLTRVGIAAAPVGEAFAITAVHTTGTKVYLLDGEAIVDGEISDVSQGAHIASTGTTLGLGLHLAGLEVDPDPGIDLVVSAPRATPASKALSGAILIFTSSSIITTPGEGVQVENADIVVGGAATNDYFGGFVLGMADVDGDGASDMAVSDYRDDDERTWYLVPGNLPHGTYSIDDVALSRVIDTTPFVADDGQVASRSACAARLDDDDGFDLVLGSPGSSTGSVSLFASSMLAVPGTYTPSTASAGVSGAAPGDFFGFAVAPVEADGDGDDDLVVTAPGLGEGAAWLIPNDL